MRAAAPVVLVVAAVLVVQTAWCARFRDFRFTTKNISSTLDNLLAVGRYDKRIRPDLGGPPTLVTVGIYIKSMSDVSETDQRYSMDTYFRQSWFDPRLRFSLPGIDEFSMSWLFLDRVWKPDTYIVNGYRSYLHRITVPNKFARVRSDGFVTYSMRLTLQASCPMHLRKFPLDSQRCPLLIGSYGYMASDLVYAWHPTGVGLEPGVELAQYDLVNVTITDELLIRRGAEEFSMISAMFHLRRNTGYYTLQVFVPCGLIVCSSWVSFWIDPDAVPARVSLAVTTVLSMTTMGFGGRSSMPKVNYATALDWFVIMCFAFVFAVMLEYAAINFIDKVTVDLRRLLEERKRKKKNSTGSVHASVSVAGPDALAAALSLPTAIRRSRSSSLDADTRPGGAQHLRRSLQERGPRWRPSAHSTEAAFSAAPAGSSSTNTTPVTLPPRTEAPAPAATPRTLELSVTASSGYVVTSPKVSDRTAFLSSAALMTDGARPTTVAGRAVATATIREGTETSTTRNGAGSPASTLRPWASSGASTPTARRGARTPDPVLRTAPALIVTPTTSADRTTGPRPSPSHSHTEDEIAFADQGNSAGAQGDVLASSSNYIIPIEVDARPAQDSLGVPLVVPEVEGVARQGSPTLRRTQSLRRCLSVPYRLWEQTRFLPNEEDVTRQMQSNEEPEKFTKIDIVSRKVFPIAFVSMLIMYWIMYGFYISDVFPGEEGKDVLYELAYPKKKV
uniref:Gamma-aminobutyric acid receptor subunit beta n=1 Tax=Frankliniella occidentalis TaxID=133901 RepID=A0A8T9KQ53_FRAOC|nr:gamma-aminobutyric acid receptor subunit GRD-like [Frankliniella occidentalis]